MKRSQGALEYLIIIAAVIAVSAVVVLFVSGSFGSTKSSANFAACKQTASSCYSSHLLSPDNPCLGCEKACVDLEGKDILEGTGYSAVDICKTGKSSDIYPRVIETPNITEYVCTDELAQSCETLENCMGTQSCENNVWSDCIDFEEDGCPEVCGDSICYGSETCETCVEDCGSCSTDTETIEKIGSTYSSCSGGKFEKFCTSLKILTSATSESSCGNGLIEDSEYYFNCEEDVPCIGQELLGYCANYAARITLLNNRVIRLYFDDYINEHRKDATIRILDDQALFIYDNFLQEGSDEVYSLFYINDSLEENVGGRANLVFTNASLTYTYAGLHSTSTEESIRHEFTHNMQSSYPPLWTSSVLPGHMLDCFIEGAAEFFEDKNNLNASPVDVFTSSKIYLSYASYSDIKPLYFLKPYLYDSVSLWAVYHSVNPDFFKDFTSLADKYNTIGESLAEDPTPFYEELSLKTIGSGLLGSVDHMHKFFFSPIVYSSMSLEGELLDVVSNGYGITTSSSPMARFSIKSTYASNLFSLAENQPIELNVSLLSFDGTYNGSTKGVIWGEDGEQMLEVNGISVPRPQAGVAIAYVNFSNDSLIDTSFNRTWATDIYVRGTDGGPLDNVAIEIVPNLISTDRTIYIRQINDGVALLNMSLDLRDVIVHLPDGRDYTFTNVLLPSSYAVLDVMSTYCGDGTCNGAETCSSCYSDCRSRCVCGDLICNSGETCSTCASDCGACPPTGCSTVNLPCNRDGYLGCCSGLYCKDGFCTRTGTIPE